MRRDGRSGVSWEPLARRGRPIGTDREEDPMRRPLAAPLLVVALASVLAACADPAAPEGPTIDERRLGVYEALTRELVATEDLDGSAWERVVIVSELCANAGSAGAPESCPDALSAAEQDELARRLQGIAERIEFVADPTPLYDQEWFEGFPHVIVVRLGTIAPHGEGVEVGGSYGCGGLCGSGTTYLLELRADGWKVVGTEGTAWIA
jgi:hypothetical protein